MARLDCSTIDPQHSAPLLQTEITCHKCGVIDYPTSGPGAGPHAARAICAHCGAFLQWLSRFPPAERMEKRLEARQAAMERLPPSEKQLAYLQILKADRPPPTSMAEASARIDALTRGERQP